MIAGPPPGATFQLIARWKEFIGHWMLERLSPPKITPRQSRGPETVEAVKPVASQEPESPLRAAVNGDSAPIELPTQRRSGEPLRWRPRV